MFDKLYRSKIFQDEPPPKTYFQVVISGSDEKRLFDEFILENDVYKTQPLKNFKTAKDVAEGVAVVISMHNGNSTIRTTDISKDEFFMHILDHNEKVINSIGITVSCYDDMTIH